MKEKVVLAYSGGLDTSYCAMYLSKEKNLEVYTALANTGGFNEDELKSIEEKAYELGSVKHVTLDVTDTYYNKCIRYMVYGNVLRNNTYPISVSSERIFQAIAIIEYAKKIGAKYVAHGSTGAGNDQVRFDLTFDVLAPDIQILTPTRDLKLSRQEEIDYLKHHGVQRDWSKMTYSINKGLWGTSIGGKETLTSDQTLPESAYPSPCVKEDDDEEDIMLDYEKGQLKAVNGETFANGVDAIRAVEALASPFGIGRDMHIGDTIIGIKGRVGFEAAAAMIIIKAHQMLEKHTLGKWQQYWKEQLGNWYGMFLHESQYLDPVMRNIETFLESTQENVTGRVIVTLKPYHYVLVGIDSPYDLMKSGFGEYGEMNNAWSAQDVKGFTKIMGNSMKIHQAVNAKNNGKN
ncbi:MAG: argininosuccinate synthase [Mangrovibacterium sp.]